MNPQQFLSFSTLAGWLASGAVGAMIGLVHFSALQWNVRLFTGGGLWRPLALQAVRFGVTVAALYLCARLGASLPAVVIGLLLARQAVLRRTA
ncbi:ATP synthase subunit I [Herbaspirillum sp. RV1423]|uniref:N-ATPase subunit AtpR n=1 Tax=Herbaspirillum sp. RV1423 TaxID=1443993 RepID=UPI0004B9242B|nr:ATP synthase subunit I [Herbaspirillum sp. RV1423]